MVCGLSPGVCALQKKKPLALESPPWNGFLEAFQNNSTYSFPKPRETRK